MLGLAAAGERRGCPFDTDILFTRVDQRATARGTNNRVQNKSMTIIERRQMSIIMNRVCGENYELNL